VKAPKAYIKTVRYGVQSAFLLLTVLIGYQFYGFVRHFQVPGAPFVTRPAGVDAFLPISGLMSFKYFLVTGTVEPVHPAAFVIFSAVLLVSLLFKKGFCGWICPIGTISQWVWMAGKKVLGRNFTMERYTDGIIRSLKYILMAIFILFIGILLNPNWMVLFFMNDYYVVADVKTMQVFTEMTPLTASVLGILLVLSFLYKNFWCRYLCPYGALLGLLSCASPVKIKRSAEHCVHCRRCSNACPSGIDVEKKAVVHSPECFGCMTCVGSCPSTGALDMTAGLGKTRRILKPLIYPAALVVLFYLVIGLGMAAGKWNSQIAYEEYQRIIPNTAATSHP
jgi:polyferredoxin